MQNVGRNDPCPCGSGKKYKKCCEAKTKHKKINAQLLSGSQANPNLAGRVQKISSLLQRPPAPSAPSEETKPNE